MKAIPPSLWNACHYVLQFNFKTAHIGRSLKRAADFISSLELKVRVKVHIKTGKHIQTSPIEVTKSSSDVDDEEQFLFNQEDKENESEKQTSHWEE